MQRLMRIEWHSSPSDLHPKIQQVHKSNSVTLALPEILSALIDVLYTVFDMFMKPQGIFEMQEQHASGLD